MTKTSVLILGGLLVIGLFLAGQMANKNKDQAMPQEEMTAEMEPAATLALDEVTQHASADDCWMAINGKVYNVTDFVATHPGGKAILQGCGIDATELFEARPSSGTPHSDTARDLLPNYYIGDLAE